MRRKDNERKRNPPPENLPATPFQAFLATIWNTRWRIPVVLLLAGGSLFLFLPESALDRLQGLGAKMSAVFQPRSVPQHFPEEPKVVAIAPDSEFGTLHFTGLELGLLYEDDLSLIRLTAPINEMKHGNLGSVMQRLAGTLAQHDVVAVVGPGITECTRDILNTVERSGNPVVVFANSAAPRYLLRTDRGSLPVFRINSGIDERAERIAQLTTRLLEQKLEQKLHVLYLVEQNPDSGRKSFGQELDSQIRRHLDLDPYIKSGLFQRRVFPSERVEDLFGELAEEFRKEQVIFLLGLGHDYKALVEEFYAVPGNGDTTRANLVGVMTSYAIDDLYESRSFLFSHLFEITDVELRTNPESIDTPDYFLTFLRSFNMQRMNPARRDEAFAFDAGLCLSKAWKAVKDARAKNAQLSYHEALTTLAEAVQSLKLRGASGAVVFEREPMTNGGSQNLGTVGTQLTLCSYNPTLREWEEMSPDHLTRFVKKPAQASSPNRRGR